ncbi:MAG TPA: polyphenol oxidase family protein [Solirubrobacteraceae bacterium]|nr:polyphenol oxidase family protein [Solirubrobacteraceae bacterium]
MSAADLTAELPAGGVCFTDRADGNMSSVGGDDAASGAENRERLRGLLRLDGLARGYQVHGTRVLIASTRNDGRAQHKLESADGQATAARSLGAMVLAADCLPVALGAPRAVAMVHAGWRGLAGGVLEQGVATLRTLSDGQVHAVLGPCAGPCCYEVGAEVHEALGTSVTGKATIDLRAIARARLEAAGVAVVTTLGGCTICDERFFSYRREGSRAGRQAGIAWLS